MEQKTEVLLRTIDEKNAKIEIYQTKLKDLVLAYKDLQKEKAAFEACVKSLTHQPASTASNSTPITNQNVSKVGGRRASGDVGTKVPDLSKSIIIDGTSQSTEPTVDGDVNAAEEGEVKIASIQQNKDDENDDELDALRNQLSTLTVTLTTVSAQKSKLEASYMADKKKLKQDLDEKEKQFNEERKELKKQIQEARAEIEQWKNKLRSQQHVQEKDSEDYAVMIRELQQLVSTERMAKEHLEAQLEDIRGALADKQTMGKQEHDLYEKTIAGLQAELSQQRSELQACKERSSEPSSLLLHLQKELIDVKESERRAVQNEAQAVQDAQNRIRVLSQTSERRITELEGKVSELSEMLGGAERLRGEDQRAMQRLRERIVQLDQENSALTQIVNSSSSSNSRFDDDDQWSITMIVERLRRLCELYNMAYKRAINDEHPLQSLEEVLKLDDGDDIDESGNTTTGSGGIHKKCCEKYELLKDEFEKYKLRAQSILRSNKNNKESNLCEREVATLRSQISELRGRLGTAVHERDTLSCQLAEKEAGFTRAIATMTETHRAELSTQDATHRHKLGELETEMRRHRERTVALLAEKDCEISVLRLQIPNPGDKYQALSDSYHGRAGSSAAYQSVADDASGAASSAEPPSLTAVNELLSRQISSGVNEASPGLLHFAQEKSRQEVEIATLRRQKHSLEEALRERHQSAAMTESMWTERYNTLAEELRKSVRDRSRESANMEYLKNVVYRYMLGETGMGAGCRQQMLNAIATILEFSPSEKQQVQTALNKGWWPHGKSR